MEQVAVSPIEAAKALGIGEALVRELIEKGDLPSVKAGRRVLVPVDGIKRYISGGKSPGPRVLDTSDGYQPCPECEGTGLILADMP